MIPSSTIYPPKTYSEWMAVLDILKAKTNDDAVLQAMTLGSLEWQTGVAERFISGLLGVVNFRLNAASDKFQRELSHAHGQERVIIQALLGLRRELSFLARAVDLPAIPYNERNRCRELIVAQANEYQRSLEDSAKRDRTGKLASIVRNNKVNAI